MNTVDIEAIRKDLNEINSFVRDRLDPVSSEVELLKEETERLGRSLSEIQERDRAARRASLLRRTEEDGSLTVPEGPYAGMDVLDVYFPYFQDPRPQLGVMVRTASDPLAAAEPLRRLFGDLDPGVPIFDLATMNERLRDEEAISRLSAQWVGGFAIVAALLVSLGLYGTIAYDVQLRRREIGIRMALGGRDVDIARWAAGMAWPMVGLGIGLGTAVTYAVGHFLVATLYGVERVETGALGLVLLGIVVLSALACTVPIRRALQIDPILVLRSE